MAYHFLKFEANWADEINIEEFDVITSEQKERYETLLGNSSLYPTSLYVGSNQEIEYTSPDEVCVSFTEISEGTYKEMSVLLDTYKFQWLIDNLSDAEDELKCEKVEVEEEAPKPTWTFEISNKKTGETKMIDSYTKAVDNGYGYLYYRFLIDMEFDGYDLGQWAIVKDSAKKV